MRSVIFSLFTVTILVMILPSNMSLADLGLGEAEEHEKGKLGFGLIGGTGRMLAGGQRKMTCDKYPRVCRVAGSPGRDCCKKTCVNVDKDRVNCGKCGERCKYSEVCCKGKCVNVLRDKKNCGGCGKRCDKGKTCRYGMCSYA